MEETKLLKKKEKATGNNNALVIVCTDLAQYYFSEQKFGKAIKEYQIVSNIYKAERKMILYGQTNRGIGEAFMELCEFEKALRHFKIYLDISKQENNLLEQQRAFAQIGHMYLTWYLQLSNESNKNYLDKAYEYFMKSLQKCEMLHDNIEKQDMLARLFSNLGLVKESLGDYKTAHSLLDKSQKICRNYELYEQLYRGHMAMASLFDKQEQYQQSLKQFNLAIEVAKKLSSNRVELVCAALLAKSDTLIKIADFSGAKLYLRKAYKFQTPNQKDKIAIEKNLRVVAAMCKLEDELITTTDTKELKTLYEQMGDGACDLRIFTKAIEYYKKMLQTAEMIGVSDKELGVCYYSLAETYKDNGQYEEAENYFEKEYDLCKNSLKDNLNTLCKIADLKELAKNPISEVKNIYERALSNCRKKGNLKEEKRIVVRYLDYLRRALCYTEAYNVERRLEVLSEQVGDDGTSSSSDYESEEFESKVHVGHDIILSDITDMSEDSDYEVPELNTVLTTKRRKSNKVVDKFKRNCNGEWPLHVSSIKGDQKMVEYWLKIDHPVNVRDNAGWLPLHEACIHGHLEIVRLLLDHKAAINDRGGTACNGITPLHDAASNGHLEVVKLLLDRGASALVKTDEGNTPLFELERWYNRTRPVFTSEQTALYHNLITRLSETVNRAGQNNLRTEKSSMCGMESPVRSPMKASTSGLSPIGRLRRKPILFDEDEDENDNVQPSPASTQEDMDASNEYQFVMQTLRHKNHTTPIKSQSKVKRLAYVDAEDYVDADDWLEDDVRPSKTKRRKTSGSPQKLARRSRSFGMENNSRTSPQKSIEIETEAVLEEEVVPADIIDDDFIPNISPVVRRRSDESKESSQLNSMRKRTQVTLLDSGFSRQRNGPSPGHKTSVKRSSTDSLSRTLGANQISSSSVDAIPNTLPTESQSVLEPTLFVDVQIEGRLFRVPVLLSQIHNKTIKWLAEEASLRYASKEYMKPTLELETTNGAVLADDDLLSLLFPMSSTQAEKVIAKVIEWSLPPLIDRYKETCNQLAVDVDEDLCQIIEALSVNLDLENRGIMGNQLCPLLKAINHQKSLTEVNLSGNFLTSSCLTMLSNSILTLPNLRCLNLSCTGLQPHHLTILTNAIVNRSSVFGNLKSLDLSDNLHLGFGCLKDVASITRAVNLETLKLRGVKLKRIAALSDPFCLKTLNCLDVSDNELDVRDVGKILSFTDGAVLRVLDISNNSLKGISELFGQQNHSTIGLETIGLARCFISDSELYQLLRIAPDLSSFNLSYNSELTSITLRRLLERSNLLHLNLTCCSDIWKYYEPGDEVDWAIDIKNNFSETVIKLSGGSSKSVECIMSLFTNKYPSCCLIRSYDFLSIVLAHT